MGPSCHAHINVIELQALSLMKGQERNGVLGEGFDFRVVEVYVGYEHPEVAQSRPELIWPDDLVVPKYGLERRVKAGR